MLRRVLPLAAALSLLSVSSPADAEELRWRDEWKRFRLSEGVVTVAAASGLATLYLLPNFEPTRGGGILFDNALRDAWKYETHEGQDRAQRLSTFGYYGLMAWPLLVDSGVALARGSGDVAAQTALIDLEAFAVAGFVFRLTEATVRRARPYTWECMQREGSYAACKESGLGGTTSFVSGHMALATTGAALICTHHLHNKLYGSIGSPIACGAAVAVSLGVGYLRIVTDNHYMTDVIAGATVGALSGWLMPTLLHYGWGRRATDLAKRYGAPVPLASAGMFGLGWSATL